MFYLGGQLIPLGVALGEPAAPLTIVDNSHQDGVFGFTSSSYTATNSPAVMGISRASSSFGTVQVSYQTTTNGTAVSGSAGITCPPRAWSLSIPARPTIRSPSPS